MIAKEKTLGDIKDFTNTKEFKALSDKYTSRMSRAERREYQRKEDKMIKCISTLTPIQTDLIDQLSQVKSDSKLEEINQIMDRSISALLVGLFPEKTWEDITKIEDIFASLVIEDAEKTTNIKNKSKGDINMTNKKLEKYSEEVATKAIELLEKGLSQKQSIDELITHFPMLSKSMVTNAYKKIKSEWDKEHKKEDPEMQEAAEKILGIISKQDSKKEVAKKTTPEIVKEVKTQAKVEVKKEIKEEVKMNRLKVLEEKVVKTIKIAGENGVYEGETGKGIMLTKEGASISFGNEKELELWVNEFKEVFARLG
ncbi:hypothetical protein KPL28_02760 [Clostridium algidicarnis]|uniref:hypothetical protein n=1 Tax=Clostridium algidicarnis TaxID=37659 RepID=UPI001C0CEE50|nr:hypothetical protein [Clostridium algidicarnis]MBU3208555.1 hypothetical protein [Clostridium algidicarnis]